MKWLYSPSVMVSSDIFSPHVSWAKITTLKLSKSTKSSIENETYFLK